MMQKQEEKNLDREDEALWAPILIDLDPGAAAAPQLSGAIQAPILLTGDGADHKLIPARGPDKALWTYEEMRGVVHGSETYKGQCRLRTVDKLL